MAAMFAHAHQQQRLAPPDRLGFYFWLQDDWMTMYGAATRRVPEGNQIAVRNLGRGTLARP